MPTEITLTDRLTEGDIDRPAWRLPEWLRLAGIARSTYYTLPEASKPRTASLNGRIYVLEHPRAWFEWMEGKQATETLPRYRGKGNRKIATLIAENRKPSW